MTNLRQNKYKIPDENRRNILSGYFSIILILIGTIFIPLFYRYLNLNWQIILTFIILIPGAILGVYFLIGFIRTIINPLIKTGSRKNKENLTIHYILIWCISIIWIVLAYFIYNTDLFGIFIPLIFIILLIKSMK